jgi:mRNA-degrading endonuclease RelE of RelBE toxin-antitoxin system
MMKRKKFSDVKRQPEFERDLKKLKKKYPTIERDLETAINTAIYAYHKQNIDIHGIFPISGLGFKGIIIYKLKEFACRSMKGKGSRTGIRVVYAYLEEEDRLELIEIYMKARKPTEDRKRINRHYFDR